MSFRRRTFPEVLDNILTSLTQGVSAEEHPFPPPGATAAPYQHSLLEGKATDIVSVYGSRFSSPHTFRKDVDYQLSGDGMTLDWIDGAQLPDSGSLFQVNYYPESAQPSLTDIHTGSVIRTLSESISLEIARLYAQLEVVYQSGFIDTATGSSLDNVVALLGIERIGSGHPAGEVEFTRSTAVSGAITIPSGTRIMNEDGSIEYETTAGASLSPGQNVVRVAARDLELNDPLGADSLTVLPIPVAGIASVTNPAPTAITSQEETDAQLRTRSKAFLFGSERATLGAITNALRRQGLSADVDEDANQPGYVTVTPHAESITPEARQRVLTAIKDARPAGVLVDLADAEPPRKVSLEFRLTTASDSLDQDVRSAHQLAREKVEDYFKELPVREAGSVNRIVGLVLSVPQIQDVRILSATWSVNSLDEDVLDRESGQLLISDYPTVLEDLHIADPNLPTLLNVVVSYASGDTPPDEAAINSALNDAISDINETNANELAANETAADRHLSYDDLLGFVTLPQTGTYNVQFTFTIETGLSRILSQSSDPSYPLTPFERLSLNGVELEEV